MIILPLSLGAQAQSDWIPVQNLAPGTPISVSKTAPSLYQAVLVKNQFPLPHRFTPERGGVPTM
jgi:hypothetical protein